MDWSEVVWLFLTLFPVVLSCFLTKRRYEDESFKYKVWLATLPFCFGMFFFGLDGISFKWKTIDFVYWVLFSVGYWVFLLIPVHYKLRFYTLKESVESLDKHPFEADDNMDEHFDRALKIHQMKKEGKDTSEVEKLYDQMTEVLKENDYESP